MLRSLVGSEMCIRDRTEATAVAVRPKYSPSISVVTTQTDAKCEATASIYAALVQFF